MENKDQTYSEESEDVTKMMIEAAKEIQDLKGIVQKWYDTDPTKLPVREGFEYGFDELRFGVRILRALILTGDFKSANSAINNIRKALDNLERANNLSLESRDSMHDSVNTMINIIKGGKDE